jgi:hypothetical protein
MKCWLNPDRECGKSCAAYLSEIYLQEGGSYGNEDDAGVFEIPVSEDEFACTNCLIIGMLGKIAKALEGGRT